MSTQHAVHWHGLTEGDDQNDEIGCDGNACPNRRSLGFTTPASKKSRTRTFEQTPPHDLAQAYAGAAAGVSPSQVVVVEHMEFSG